MMDQPEQQKDKALSRRDALKTLIAAGGATALATLPEKWEAPMVKVGALPAFAQASPTTFPFTTAVSVTVDDIPTGGLDTIPGWLRIYIPETAPQPRSAPAEPALKNGRDRKGPPYKRLNGPVKVAITYTFIALTGFGFNDLPAAGTPLWCYGVSDDDGPVDDGVEEAEIVIINNIVQVTFVFFLPGFFRGRFFFCSANFTALTIVLIGGIVLNPIFFFGPGLFGDSCLCPDPDDGVLDVETLANCYRISFLGVIDNGDNTSTWRYRVEELACAQDLSNWVLSLPLNCTNVIAASPEPWEIVQPDPNAGLTGIKWETGAGFQQGEFSVTLAGVPGSGSFGTFLTTGTVLVAAKGPDLAYGSITGPVCGP